MPSTSFPISRDPCSSVPAAPETWSRCVTNVTSRSLARAISTPSRRACCGLLRGGGDLLGRRVQLLRRRRDLLCHRGKLLGLRLDPAHIVRDGRGGAIHAHTEEAQLVALPVPDQGGEVSPLHLP